MVNFKKVKTSKDGPKQWPCSRCGKMCEIVCWYEWRGATHPLLNRKCGCQVWPHLPDN